MKQSLEKRIIMFSFMLLFMTITASTILDIAVFRKDFVKEMMLRTGSLAAAFRVNVENVLALGIDIRDVSGLSEKCREIVQNDPEMSYCIILSADGKPLYFNDPAFKSVDFTSRSSKKIIHNAITAHAVIIGPQQGVHYDTSTPVRGADGATVAYIHIGFPQEIINAKVYGIVIRAVIVLVLFFCVSFALVVVFVKRCIMQPVSTLLDGVTRISQGSFTQPIPELTIYEMHELGAKINAMAEALDARDSALRKNYQELSETHAELRTSYLKLEELSLNLEKSEELHKKLLEEASDAIIILDDNQNVMIINKMAEEFFGHSAAQFIGKHISHLLITLNVDNIQQHLKVFINAYEGRYISEEITIVNSGSEQRVGRIHASCISNGEDRLLQVIIRDVTKETETVANLERSAAELSRLNRMKDSFLGLASHEIKTPLTVIMGYSELLLSDMSEQLTPTTAEMVNNIATSASRLDGIVRDMIDVSKLDQNKLELKFGRVNINELVNDCVRELRYFVAVRNQEIEVSLETKAVFVSGDYSRLMQLMANIVGNAIKFTPDKGKISISVTLPQAVSVLPFKSLISPLFKAGSEKFVEIIVRDTGIGIDREDQARIFDKFVEVGNIEEHSSGKVAFKSRGAGLGLAISKGIVEMHGGGIWVESVGHDPARCPGSAFYILLPLDPDQEAGTL